MQLIKADLQLLIHIFIDQRVQNNIKNNKRRLKYNYEFKKEYLIELVLLEKQLILDYTKRIAELIIYLVLDLKVYYDR